MLFLRALSTVLLTLPFCVEGVDPPQPSQEMFVAIRSDKGYSRFGAGFLSWTSHFPETSADVTYYFLFFFFTFPLFLSIIFHLHHEHLQQWGQPCVPNPSRDAVLLQCISPADTTYPPGWRMEQTPPLPPSSGKSLDMVRLYQNKVQTCP